MTDRAAVEMNEGGPQVRAPFKRSRRLQARPNPRLAFRGPRGERKWIEDSRVGQADVTLVAALPSRRRLSCADARRHGAVRRLGSFVRSGEELRNRSRACLGRDWRPERRRQAGPSNRKRQRGRHRLGACQQGRRQLPGQARLPNGGRPFLGRDRRPERRRDSLGHE
jgi:hypothetical protein